MEIQGKTTEQGATHNTATGKTQVPNGQGGVSEETRQKLVDMFGPDTVIMSKGVYDKFVESVGAQAEDAKARGLRYEPKLTERFTNIAKKNINPINLFVAVVVAGGTYYVGKKAGNWIARKMGWNLFGNIVLDNSVQGEEIGRLRVTPRSRNIGTPASVSVATA